MKIAVLSDIHSNLDALEAVLADAKARRADIHVVAGDLLSDAPSPRETLDCVRGLTPHVIKGNREDYMLKYRAGRFPGWRGSKQFSSALWTYEQLRPGDMDYIAGLPEQIIVHLDGKTSLRVVHGSPFSMYELLKPDEDMAPVERAASAVSEQALVFGHNHMQWTGTVRGRLLLNPGTVGVHFNHARSAEYGLLTYENGVLSAELLRVPYDFAALEKRLETSGLMAASPVWTKITFEGVKAGRNYCLDFLNEAFANMKRERIARGSIPNEIWDKTARQWWKRMGWGPGPE
jgi:putative phosphoesterase